MSSGATTPTKKGATGMSVSAFQDRSGSSRLALFAALVGCALVAGPLARSGGNAITASSAAPTTASGVYFTVSAGGGNRGFASIAVSCTSDGSVVYANLITVEVPAKGTSTSATIYPPASSCDATLEKEMQIGKFHVLGTVSFTVTA